MALSSFLLARGDTKRRKRKGGILRSPRFGKRGATNPPAAPPHCSSKVRKERDEERRRGWKNFAGEGATAAGSSPPRFNIPGMLQVARSKKEDSRGTGRRRRRGLKMETHFREAHTGRGAFSLSCS